MRDGEIVAATLDGDPAALIDAYDQYAPGLYAYCQSMLSRPADASDAVQDTFVVAAAKLGSLRDPGRLRPWLFAVARNECRRQLDGPRVSRSADDDMTMISERIRVTDYGQPGDEPGQQELVSSALATLSREDQEIIELTVRHGLSGADLADVLGVPANQSQLVASRARTRLDSALGTVLTARPRLGACPELASLLTDSADELTGAERKLVRRHLSTCPICTDHHRPEVNAAALLGAQPAPVPPSGLRFQMLSLLRDTSPGAVGYCAEVAERAEPFTRSGFPAAVAPVSAARGPVSFIPGGRAAGRAAGGVRRGRRAGHEHAAPRRGPAAGRGGPGRLGARRADGAHAGRGPARQEGPGRHQYPWIDRVRIRQDRRGGQEDQPPRHPDADQDQAQHAAELAPGHHAGQHPTNHPGGDGQSDAHADRQRRGQQPDRLDYRDTVGGLGATLASARSSAAAIRSATSLPNADSRGRYFIPQSGASTSRSAGT